MKRLIIILLLMLFNSICKSQVTQEWLYNQAGNYAKFMIYDTSGYVVISSSGAEMDAPPLTGVKKINSNGTALWSGGCYGDNYGLANDGAKNVYIASFMYASWGQPKQINLIKYNSNGVQQWVMRDTAFFQPDALVFMRGDYAGNIYMLMHRNLNFEISKYNTNGSRLWLTSFSETGSSDNYPVSFEVDNNGNVYLIGKCTINSATYFKVIKYNSSGVQQWVKTITPQDPAASYNSISNIKIDLYGNIIVQALMRNTAGNYADLVIIKYNSSGVQQWINFYGQGSIYEGGHLLIDRSNNIITRCSAGTLKYSSSGVQQWIISPTCSALGIDKFSNIYLSRSSGTSYTLFKFDSLAAPKWQINYDAGFGFTGVGLSCIAPDTALNIYVAGGCMFYYNPPYVMGYAIRGKYSQIVGMTNNGHNVPDEYNLSQNYPNPFNPTTKIKFSLPNPSKGGEQEVRLIIYDVLGKEITNLIPPLWGGQEGLQPGTYEVEWDGSNFASGIYFYKLQTADFSETKKMVLLK